jgi:AraC family ethanolamine operon transcriptional activator
MEQEAIETLAECLSAGKVYLETPATRRHQEVMLRFEELLQTRLIQHPGAKELSAAIHVSERLLNKCCKQVLGMSPTSYVRLRALHAVHRILRSENPGTTSVSRVARSHGFESLGHFAAAYRSLFGELPSASFRRVLQR